VHHGASPITGALRPQSGSAHAHAAVSATISAAVSATISAAISAAVSAAVSAALSAAVSAAVTASHTIASGNARSSVFATIRSATRTAATSVAVHVRPAASALGAGAFGARAFASVVSPVVTLWTFAAASISQGALRTASAPAQSDEVRPAAAAAPADRRVGRARTPYNYPTLPARLRADAAAARLVGFEAFAAAAACMCARTDNAPVSAVAHADVPAAAAAFGPLCAAAAPLTYRGRPFAPAAAAVSSRSAAATAPRVGAVAVLRRLLPAHVRGRDQRCYSNCGSAGHIGSRGRLAWLWHVSADGAAKPASY